MNFQLPVLSLLSTSGGRNKQYNSIYVVQYMLYVKIL